MELSTEVLMDMHRRMVRIRLFEEAAGQLAEAAKLPGFLHLYVGQEAVASGVCTTLSDDDQITSTHRGHGHLVAKGGEFRPMMAELMGKSTGYSKGKGGSMHISNLDVGMLGANGIVGAGAPIAVGAGFANKYKDNGNVAAAFFGDGSTNIGAFHEAANMACALQAARVVHLREQRVRRVHARDKTMAITDIVDRAAGYGMPGVIVDGMDVVAVHEAAVEAGRTRSRGEGPSLIEAKTYRFYNHHGVQNLGLKYRTDDEVAEWKRARPDLHVRGPDDRGRHAQRATTSTTVWAELRADIDDAIQFAEDSPLPDPDQLLVDVYTLSTEGAAVVSRKISYVQAFNEAVRQEMAADDDVFCAGEDIGAFGGVFQSYAGLQAEFGEARVVDTPISEQAIIGLGVGAAVTGLRPIVDIMFMDFICVAFDQIVNQAAKLKYMFGGAATIPLTITTGGGGGLSAAAQHSQSLEALICHIPGLKVVHPSNPYDMKGLMTACIRENNPTIMIKHKRLLGM